MRGVKPFGAARAGFNVVIFEVNDIIRYQLFMVATPQDVLGIDDNTGVPGCKGCWVIVAALIVGSIGAAVLGVAILVLLLWPLAFSYAWQWLSQFLASAWMRLAVTCMLLIVAAGLFTIRERLRRTYGAFEVLLGAATIWFGLTPTANSVSATLAVAGGVYIVVRGLDNYARGQEQFLKLKEEAKRLEEKKKRPLQG